MIAYTCADMRSADKYAIEELGIPGTVLMDSAAGALFDALDVFIGKGDRFVILCGKGNNGGDGWALALRLAKICERVVCISAFGEPTTTDAKYFHGECVGFFETDKRGCLTIIDAERDIDTALCEIRNADVIVDTLFGTGFSGEIGGDSIAARLILLANEVSAYRLAADVPSGASANTGEVSDISFRAHRTVTFAKAKPGLFSYPARSVCGEITVADIGIPERAFGGFEKKYEVICKDTVREFLPSRGIMSSKGDYGRLLSVCGSDGMPGAACLAVSGALRMGVGLICAASTDSVLKSISGRYCEPIYMSVSSNDDDTDRLIEYSKRCSALLIGCGLGGGEAVEKRVCRLIRECACPIILDADGINAVLRNINILTEARCGILLTPHPLEFARLTGLSVTEINKRRIECASDFSERYGCTLLLKGAGTIIADKGKRVAINTTGNSALSKGGSGDVLSGMISAMAAQGCGLYESAVIGAYLHGAAGEALARVYSEYGVLPSDLPSEAAKILADIVAVL